MTQLTRQGDEAAALVRLGFDELNGFTRSIGTTERDIAARVFRYVPAGRPIQFVHDTVANGLVGAFGGATAALGRGAEALVGRRPRPQRPLSATIPGGLGLTALNGLVGDRLEREGSSLHEPISVRVDGLAVAPERDELARAFPEATRCAQIALPPRARTRSRTQRATQSLAEGRRDLRRSARALASWRSDGRMRQIGVPLTQIPLEQLAARVLRQAVDHDDVPRRLEARQPRSAVGDDGLRCH
jgi:hypothetical protein